MTIKGLTDKLERRMPKLGQLRKGEKKKGNRPGKDLTYFRFVCQDPTIDRRFHEIYDKEPRLCAMCEFAKLHVNAMPCKKCFYLPFKPHWKPQG